MHGILKPLFCMCFTLLLAVYAKTAAVADEMCNETTIADSENSRMNSLQSIYYRCGPLPSEPTQTEIDDLVERKKDPKLKSEAAFLNKAFGSDLKLQAWAVRDHDGDWIKDYRISPSGQFKENDTDVDCDGIANVLDDTPYGAVTNGTITNCWAEPDRVKIGIDQNDNGVPDHIDWRLLDEGSQDPRPAKVQEGLLKDYGITLVDRRLRMTPAMATELDLIIRKIYNKQITPELPALRVIATDKDACGGAWAFASPQSSTLFFYPGFPELDAFLRLETFVHELGHMIQFSLDYTTAHLYRLRRRNAWQTDGFAGFIKKFGWTRQRNHKEKSYEDYQLAVPNCLGNDKFNGIYDPYHWSFKGEDAKTWQDRWDFYTDTSWVKLHENTDLERLHMIGGYAYSTAWEWHAEHMAAFAMNRILQAATSLCTADQMDEFNSKLHVKLPASEYYFDHTNAIGLDVYDNQIASQFHVSDYTWLELAQYYIRASEPGACGLAPLQ